MNNDEWRGLERAISICLNEQVDDTATNECCDYAYNQAIQDVVRAIRAAMREMTPPK